MTLSTRRLLRCAVLCFATPVFAQSTSVESTEVPEVTRDSAPAVVAVEPPESSPSAAPSPSPEVVQRVAPARPALSTSFGVDGLDVALTGSVRVAETYGTPVVLDDTGLSQRMTPFETRLRLGPAVHYRAFGLVSEIDVASGALLGVPDSTVVAARTPVPNFNPIELRQLYLEYAWSTGVVRLGQQTSHFGLGMLANAGAKDAEPGDFGHQHFGSLSWRALVAARPFAAWGGAWRAVEPVAAFDLVVRDSTAELAQGDRALQGIIGLRFNADDAHQVGLTAIYRSQRPLKPIAGERATDAFILDLNAKWMLFEQPGHSLSVAGEVAGIAGTSTQARSDTAELLAVRQLGAVAKVGWKWHALGVLADAGFASGDQNPYDASMNAFRFDRDYKVGLMLFDQVLAWQSARTGLRAADPNLAAVPAEGVNLLPTGGAVTGAWYLFPRATVTLTDWLTFYGGPLFAWTTATLTDPFTTRVYGGGVSTNSLGGKSGNVLGTELDLGLSARFKPMSSLIVSATLEGGVLLPGNAFVNAAGEIMGPMGMGRLRLAVAL